LRRFITLLRVQAKYDYVHVSRKIQMDDEEGPVVRITVCSLKHPMECGRLAGFFPFLVALRGTEILGGTEKTFGIRLIG
jgi:hypothetical protein